ARRSRGKRGHRRDARRDLSSAERPAPTRGRCAPGAALRQPADAGLQSDGGRVLRALLAMRMPYVRATRIAAGIGQAIALVFAVVGFAVFHNPMLIFVGLFVFLMAGEEQALARARATMTGFPVRSAMITEFDTLEVTDPLQRAVDLLMTGSQQDFPVLENGAPIGILSRADLIAALRSHGAQAPV